MERRALRFLRWFCPDYLLEEIEGDLLQKFGLPHLPRFTGRKRSAFGKCWVRQSIPLSIY
jgi:hypothetical protein